MRTLAIAKGTGAALTMAIGGLLASSGVAWADPQYCTAFNNHYLTRILTDRDDCGSYPCGFYGKDFGDAVESCGDEVFRVQRPGASNQVTCDFCYWSNCWTVRKNTFGVTALDEIVAAQGSPLYRELALSSPSTQVIFRGGHGDVVDNPPFVYRATLDASRVYLFWLIQDHSLEEALADVSVPVFYSITGSNSDRYNHLISLTSAQNDGATAFAWEDLEFGGDNDINDVVFTTSCQFTMRPAPGPMRNLPHRQVQSPLPTRMPQAPRVPTSNGPVVAGGGGSSEP